ncbi:PHO85 cyclin-6 [Apiospora marii]|uniref:PHO85 cyclin-6 n=1 Tax=Apiospora marii TaxID=335849 RepID=UPI00312DCB26
MLPDTSVALGAFAHGLRSRRHPRLGSFNPPHYDKINEMAAVIGDYAADHSRFHNMMASGLQHDRSQTHESTYRSEPRSRPREVAPSLSTHPSTSPKYKASTIPSTAPSKRTWDTSASGAASETDSVPAQEQETVSASGGASRFPSPPDSSSSTGQRPQHGSDNSVASMASQTQTTVSSATSRSSSHQQQPSPESDTNPLSAGPRATPYNASSSQGHTIVVRDLAHIRELAQADLMNGGNGPGIFQDPPLQAMKYEISGMPIGDIIEMVAALLTKITTTNDLQHDALHRNAAHQQTAASHNNDGATMSPLSSSVLAFHGKNVPAITILSYLSRIHKYCPTTYEVFLSLLVYFDRMTERVNNMVMEAEEARRKTAAQNASATKAARSDSDADTEMKDAEGEQSDETDSDLADDDEEGGEANLKPQRVPSASSPASMSSPATYFVVDSFNIHRLIIAGVTCASKFFSDVFYTNSRYAKVGGLPLAELNHLELQFLLLNDFRLAVPVEDLEAYATMLVEFYAREVVAQRP